MSDHRLFKNNISGEGLIMEQNQAQIINEEKSHITTDRTD